MLVLVATLGCSRDRQVPFGLEPSLDAPAEPTTEVPAEPTVGEVYPPGEQLTLNVGEAAHAFSSGHALASLPLDLDEDGALDLFYLRADAQRTELGIALQRTQHLDPRGVAEFVVPDECQDARGTLSVLNAKMVLATVEHVCPDGERETYWLATVEAQPRIRERITLLPPTEANPTAISLTIAAADQDQDGHDDVVVTFVVGGMQVPVTWLDRPGGFARDTHQPEQALHERAQEAAKSTVGADAMKRAREVLSAFETLCREGGDARVGFSGTQGIQCKDSEGAGVAAAVLVRALVRQNKFFEAHRVMEWFTHPDVNVPTAELDKVRATWKKARTPAKVKWESVDTESSEATLWFQDAITLRVGGARPREIDLRSKTRTSIRRPDGVPPVHDPSKRFGVRQVLRTCNGYEAEIQSLTGQAKRRSRALLVQEPQPSPCSPLKERKSSPDEWQVLGWAPQGLVAFRGTRLRVVPLDTTARPAGQPIDLQPDGLPPAPLAGAAVTPTGSHHVLATRDGLLLRQLGRNAKAIWIRPSDWDSVAGDVRNVALSPDATLIAVRKGSDIRVVRW